MASRIQGITVEIGGDTTKLSKALESVNKSIKGTQSGLKDVATYKTNFGVTLTSKGNRRTLDSFMGYKRSDMDGNVVYVDAPYKVYGFSIQYRRYLTTAAKREREEAV